MKKVMRNVRVGLLVLAVLLLTTNLAWGAGEKPTLYRLQGINRYETAAAISQQGWTTSGSVVLVSGADFPDALVGAGLAYQLDAPILLCAPTQIREETLAEIKRLQAKNIYILGSYNAISKDVEQQLKASYQVTRIGGAERLDTAAAVARYMAQTKPFQMAVIATQENFPDALSAAPLAAQTRAPVLFSGKDSLREDTLQFLKESGIKKVLIVGGLGVLSEAVEQQLNKAGITEIYRLSGSNRYETSLAVARYWTTLREPSGFALATGDNYPDALTGAVLAAKRTAPVLLVSGSRDNSAVLQYITRMDGRDLYVLGGPSAVSEETVRRAGIQAGILMPQPVRLPSLPIDTTRGNTIGNITNLSIAAQSSGWIFYKSNKAGFDSTRNGEWDLYKMRTDGTGITRLSTDSPSNINVIGDWIYYANGVLDIYRIKTDGTGNTKVATGRAMQINVVGDWIYYTNYPSDMQSSDFGRMFKVRTDGSGLQKISDDKVQKMVAVGNWIYYVNMNDGGSIYKIRIDGTGRTKVNQDDSSWLNITGSWVYYVSNDKDNQTRMYKIKTDGTDKTLVVDAPVHFLNVAGDYTYFAMDGSRAMDSLCRMKLDGSDFTLIRKDEDIEAINIVGDWIFYQCAYRDAQGLKTSKYYRMRNDGSQRELIYQTR